MARLGDVCIINPKGKSLDDDCDVSFVPMQSVSEDGTVDVTTIRKYGEVKKGFTNFQDGDILFAKITPCMENGKGCIANGLKNGMGFGSTEFHVLRPKSELVTSEWIYYLTSWPEFRKECEKNMTGSAGQKRVPKTFLENYQIDIPSLDEQDRITAQLDKVSDLIAKREAQLNKLDLLVKARFVEMFGDPAGNPMKWEETTIGRECYYIKDGPHKSLKDVGKGNGYPFISVRNIVNGSIDFSTAKYISEQDYFESIKKCNPQKGDMLYSKGGTTGIAKLIDVDTKFANWVHVAVLKFDDSLDGIFFENMLNSEYCYTQSQRLTKGVANRDLVLSAMAKIQLYKPPVDLQKKFACFARKIEKTKLNVRQSLEELEILKKALIQEYFWMSFYI